MNVRNFINAWNSGNPVGAYAYNLFGNQVSYTPDGVVFTNYTYRPDGLRHSIGDKVHLWDGVNIVVDVDGSDVVVYFRGINLIYADDGNRTYYHFNAHGDVVVLTNSNGSKTKSYSYNAFGVEYNEATLDDNPFRYCGEYYDKESKAIYLRARYYNAAQGRFTQQDGWEFANPKDPLSLNLYTYCNYNAVNYLDPSGHLPIFGLIMGIALIVATTMLSGCTAEEKPPVDYRENNSENINCYMYAFDLDAHPQGYILNPGSYSSGNQMYQRQREYDVNEIAELVLRDMQALGKEVRILSSPSEKADDEYLVALRSTTQPILIPISNSSSIKIPVTDYHFAVQLSDGTWAEKLGTAYSRWNEIDGMSPETWGSAYDSEIVYFAVKK